MCKDHPFPHVLAAHTPNSDVSSSGHLCEAQCLQTAACSETTDLLAEWQSKYRQNTHYVGCARKLVTWTLDFC